MHRTLLGPLYWSRLTDQYGGQNEMTIFRGNRTTRKKHLSTRTPHYLTGDEARTTAMGSPTIAA
jgi:hypothetical protein